MDRFYQITRLGLRYLPDTEFEAAMLSLGVGATTAAAPEKLADTPDNKAA